MKEIRCRVHGKVQMVMFRDFVQKKARSLTLAGYAQNMPDGSVEVVAQGEEKNLKRLITYLHEGPLHADVSRVDVEWGEIEERMQGFEIVW